MGRPVITACSLLIVPAWGCSAALPVRNDGGASNKVVIDAEWSVDAPTAELLGAVRDGQPGELPQQLQAAIGDARPAAAPPPDAVPAEAAVARPAATAVGIEASVEKPPVSAAPLRPPLVKALVAATRTATQDLTPCEGSGRCQTEASDRVPPVSPRVAAPGCASRPLEPHDLRLKAIVRDARGEAVAQLELPDGSTLIIRRGQRLQLPNAGQPAEVCIERIDDAQVQLRFNGSPQVLILQ